MSKRIRAVLCAVLLSCVSHSWVTAQDSITIEPVSLTSLFPATTSINMECAAPVEGFVLAVAYDTALLSITGISITGTVTESAGAELVVPEIFEAQGGFTLGVVLDAGSPSTARRFLRRGVKLRESISWPISSLPRVAAHP